MGKKDEYRFNLRFDETDEMHRLVVKYLNSCGHNKAKYIVRAFLAYWKMSGKSLLSYVFPEIDAEQLLPEAKQENDKKTAVVAKASDAENDNGTYIQKDHSEQQLFSCFYPKELFYDPCHRLCAGIFGITFHWKTAAPFAR